MSTPVTNSSVAPVARPTSILIAALGGEGGGVLLGWLVDCARAAGVAVQATSVPGVAQRTGATSYYLEFMEHLPDGRAPVFALSPVAGAVDVVVASELLEAGRVIERGFVTDVTTLVTSSSRVYTTLEKMHGADGRFDPERLHEAGRALAGRYCTADFQQLALDHGTMISATLFGALAGAGVLPWSAALCEQIIGGEEGGRRAAASIAGFRAACAAVAQPRLATTLAPARPAVQARWAERIARLPAAVQDNAAHAVVRLTGYQDEAYAATYLERLESLCAVAGPAAVLAEAARLLALWMSYEDIFRVAQQKTDPRRFVRIRGEARVAAGELLVVTEHFKPGVDEVAAALPASMGAWLLRKIRPGTTGRGLHLPTTRVWGYLALRLLAGLRGRRRASLRFAQEQQAIEAWLAALKKSLSAAPDYAAQLVRLPALRRGYSDTHARGLKHYAHLFETLVTPALTRGLHEGDAAALKTAIDAAQADPEGPGLNQALTKLGAQPVPVAEKPIMWAPRQRGAAKPV